MDTEFSLLFIRYSPFKFNPLYLFSQLGELQYNPSPFCFAPHKPACFLFVSTGLTVSHRASHILSISMAYLSLPSPWTNLISSLSAFHLSRPYVYMLLQYMAPALYRHISLLHCRSRYRWLNRDPYLISSFSGAGSGHAPSRNQFALSRARRYEKGCSEGYYGKQVAVSEHRSSKAAHAFSLWIHDWGRLSCGVIKRSISARRFQVCSRLSASYL